MRDIIIYAVIFALLSSIYIAAGLRVLIAKRPFIVSPRRQVILSLAPSMAFLLYAMWPKYPGQSWLLVFIVIGCMMVVWGINLSRGYRVWGATGTVLHDASRYALNNLNLPYEESTQAFRLPTLNNELLIEATRIDGMFNLRLKRFSNRRVIRQLAAEIEDFFKTAPVRTNRRVSYVLVVVGAALLLSGSWVTYDRLSIHAEMYRYKAHPELFRSPEK